MADSDSFVQEVTEEVRRDAMFAAWKTYGPFVIAAIAAVVIGTATMAWWRGHQENTMREQGGAFIEAQALDDQTQSAEAFQSLASGADGDYAAMAALRAGAALGGAGDIDGAVEQYNAVAAMPDIDTRLRDLAKLRAIMVRADTMDPDEMLDGLQPLTEVGAPWRNLAFEFSAAAYLRKGDLPAAVGALETLVEGESVPPATRSRAREMIAALGGDVPERATGADDNANEGEGQ